MSRLEKLQARVEEPFLVSLPVNVRYLTGFDSSNAALVVEQDRVRLFSDFRYAEAGRTVEGVEFTATKRNLFADLAGGLSGTVAFAPADGHLHALGVATPIQYISVHNIHCAACYKVPIVPLVLASRTGGATADPATGVGALGAGAYAAKSVWLIETDEHPLQMSWKTSGTQPPVVSASRTTFLIAARESPEPARIANGSAGGIGFAVPARESVVRAEL